MREYILSNDKYKMNWIDGNTEWGTVKCPKGIVCEKKTERNGDTITEIYTFTNTSDKDIFTSLTDIAIYTPFNDDYPNAETCVTNRCHAHTWCGENVSYIMALRMGGEPPHAGLVLTKGSIGGYSIERDFARMSNDRGDFLLHPSPVSLAPNESFTIEWTLFPHNGREDFFEKAKEYNPKFIEISAEKYILFGDERPNIKIIPAFEFGNVSITKDNNSVYFTVNGSDIIINDTNISEGENIYNINIDGILTHCGIYALPDFDTLAKTRCHFIADNQQCMNRNSRLHGAYLTYDNEEKHTHYSKDYDLNGGRERICMGIAIAKYLQTHEDEVLENSLKTYVDYVKRELVDTETGEVFNDYMRDNSYKRLYNYTWASLLFIELYRLYSSTACLIIAYKILKRFYDEGGNHFYAIETPADLIVECLRSENMIDEAEQLINCFREHCDYFIERGLSYPAHEVQYEQSIVAPAADLLLKTYCITKDEKYLRGAKIHINALDLFNGVQPDYHLYETAIRHWDGYWFGKRKLYGDTFPHYWSALTGRVFKRYGEIIKDDEYIKRGEYSLRSVLSMFRGNGEATCAYVYPKTVNGIKADFADPYANDQDWGLYFMMCGGM